MKRIGRIAIGLVTAVLGTSAARAQDWLALAGPYSPSPSPAPAAYTTYGTPVSTGLVTVYAAGQTAGVPTGWTGPGCRSAALQPAPYTAAYAPAAYAPMAVTYRPAVTVNYVQPTVAYSPVPAAVYPAAYAAQPVAVGPRVWVKPKVYVEGQPLRNLLRAITP